MYLGKMAEMEDVVEAGLAEASDLGDATMASRWGWQKAMVLGLMQGDVDEGLVSNRNAYAIYFSAMTAEQVEKEETTQSLDVILRAVGQRDFDQACDDIVNGLKRGMDYGQRFWEQWHLFLYTVGFWEVDNFKRGGGTINVERLETSRSTVKGRLKALDGLCECKYVKHFVDFMDSFATTSDWSACEASLAGAQDTENVFLAKIAKFYGALGRLAFDERTRRGIVGDETKAGRVGRGGSWWGKRWGGAKRQGAVVSPGRVDGGRGEGGEAGQATEQLEDESDVPVIRLQGSSLKLMRDAMKDLKEVNAGIFSRITEKQVAIDDGVSVLFRWGEYVDEDEEEAGVEQGGGGRRTGVE